MNTLDNDAAAEAFAACYCRLLVTAEDHAWLQAAANAVTGYGTSVIGCDAEVGVERWLPPTETPDGRVGVSVMAFTFNASKLGRAVANRLGQGVLTCPTAAVFDGLPTADSRLSVGDYLRYFGDGHESNENGHWAVPIMEGAVSLPAKVGYERGVAGGNLIFIGATPSGALDAAKRAADSVSDMPGVITPFPGGVCRSGSKVGSRYQNLIASTNEAYCPTLRDRVATKLPVGGVAAYEVIINGQSEAAVRTAMRTAIAAAPGEGLIQITAASYGGSLGSTTLPLRDLV